MYKMMPDLPPLCLNGTWKYAIDADETGRDKKFYAEGTDCSAWKDMTIPTNWYLTEVGDYFGTIWFRTTFRTPAHYAGKKIFLRFAAVDYYADVWLNGKYLGSHEGMFNPFEFDVTATIRMDGETYWSSGTTPRAPTRSTSLRSTRRIRCPGTTSATRRSTSTWSRAT